MWTSPVDNPSSFPGAGSRSWGPRPLLIGAGALAAALVGVSEFYTHGEHLSVVTRTALGLEVFLGFLTFTGSLMAFGKLQGIITGAPITYKAWVCNNPGCGFNIRIDNGEISFGKALGQSFK